MAEVVHGLKAFVTLNGCSKLMHCTVDFDFVAILAPIFACCSIRTFQFLEHFLALAQHHGLQ